MRPTTAQCVTVLRSTLNIVATSAHVSSRSRVWIIVVPLVAPARCKQVTAVGLHATQGQDEDILRKPRSGALRHLVIASGRPRTEPAVGPAGTALSGSRSDLPMHTETTRSLDSRCPFESLPRPVLPMPRPSPPLGVLTDVRKGDPIVCRPVGSVAPLSDLCAPALDSEIIDRLKRLGESINEDLLGQLSELFLTDADAQIGALRGALADADAVALVGAAHFLRGASANLGARELAYLCGQLEADAAADDLSTGNGLVDALEAELVRVSEALRRTVMTP